MPSVTLRVFFIAWLAASQVVVASPAKSVHLLTTCSAIKHLSAAEAHLGYPVHLRAVVTFFDPNESNLFVQDKTGGIYVRWQPSHPHPNAGQFIELDGVAAQDDFAPQVNYASWKLIGNAPMPVPQKVSYPEMASTTHDSNWVEIQGVVRQTAHVHRIPSESLFWIKLAMEGGMVEVNVPWQNDSPPDLVDATVRVRAVCGAAFNSKNQLVGVQLYTPDAKQIDVIKAATPFEPAPAPIEQLQRFGSGYSLGRRVKVAGTVTAAMPGQGFYLRDATASINVLTRQDIALKPGDKVETLGFVEIFESHVRLVDASVRITGGGSAPPPILIKMEQALTGKYDSELVVLEGRVVRSSVWRDRPMLTLHENSDIFSISPIPGTTLGELPKDNSSLKVTGILTDEIDSMDRVVAINLLCRSASDIVITQRPPWWNLRNALTVSGILAGAALLILAWVIVLSPPRRAANRSHPA